PHKKGVANILRVHEQMHFLVHRDGHLGGDDVVSRLNIVFLVEAEEFLRTFVDPLRMKRAKLSIRTGVTKIESELPGLNLNRHRIRRGRSEINACPCLHAKNSKGQDFHSHHQQSSDHQGPGAAWKTLEFCLRAAIRKLPDKKRQQELRSEKRDSGLRHGFSHLLINQMSMSRNVRGRFPRMHD